MTNQNNAAQPADQEIEAIMEQAQVFASAWSFLGGPFDNGSGLEQAERERSNLRALLSKLRAEGVQAGDERESFDPEVLAERLRDVAASHYETAMVFGISRYNFERCATDAAKVAQDMMSAPTVETWTTGDDDLDTALNMAGMPGDAALAQVEAVERLKARLASAPVAEPEDTREDFDIWCKKHGYASSGSINMLWSAWREALKRASAPVAGEAHQDLAPPDCPITRRPFFIALEHPELGMVPTYGGPYDSYTIPHLGGKPDQPWHERELRVYRYDHDQGGWRTDEVEVIPLRIVHEDVLHELQDAAPQASVQCGSCGYTADPECAACNPAPQASEAVRNAGIELAAAWVDKRRHDFDHAHGYMESDTGAWSFGRGDGAIAKEEYSAELAEIVEGLRALKTQADKPSAPCSCPSGDGSLRHPCAVHPQASEAVRTEALYLLREARALLPTFTTAEAIGNWSEKVNRFAAGDVIDIPPKADKDGGDCAKGAGDERALFEEHWTRDMNTEEMDLERCEFPFTKYEDQPYACHETNRGWVTWQARAALSAQPGAQKDEA